jgi:hypothetical protein
MWSILHDMIRGKEVLPCDKLNCRNTKDGRRTTLTSGNDHCPGVKGGGGGSGPSINNEKV